MSAVRTKPRQRRSERLPEAGELLAIEAIDRSGLVVTSEGALVRILHVIPPNPLILAQQERGDLAAAFCHVVSRLQAEQTLQFYVEARPMDLEQVLADARAQVAAWDADPEAGGADDPLALSRWRLHAGMEESLRLHCDDQAAVQLNAYVVVPYLPSRRTTRAVLNDLRPRRWKLPVASLERDLREHRRAVRESLAHADAIRAELDALSMPTRFLDGEEVAALLWARFNPTTADAHRRRPRFGTELLGELDPLAERAQAREAAVRLRERIATSSLDFRHSRHHAEVDRDVEQTIYAATTADATTTGWLMGAMMTWQPFTLSVYVHALDRKAERTRVKRGHRRLFAVNRTAEAKGRVPDFDRYAQEHESEALLQEMAGHDRAALYRVSIYQSIRAPGPDPNAAELERRSTTAPTRSSRRPTAASTAGTSNSTSCGPRRCRSDATSPAARAATRRATSATRCRSSEPAAARRAGSRSRSATPGARSSTSTRTTARTRTTRCSSTGAAAPARR